MGCPRHVANSKEFIAESDEADEDDSDSDIYNLRSAPPSPKPHSKDIDEISSSDSSSLSTQHSGSQQPLTLTDSPSTRFEDAIDKVLVGGARSSKSGKQKRKALDGGEKPAKNKGKKTKVTQDSDENTHVLDLGFNLSFYVLKEGSKDLKKRIACHNAYMKLNNDKPFDTFKAQLLVRIDKYFTPRKLDIANYLILFSILRISPMPMTLAEGEDYQLLLKRIAKAKDHTCAIYGEEHLPLEFLLSDGVKKKRGKENREDGEEDEDDESHKNKRAKKMKPPKSADIHSANIPHNDNIKALYGQWMCHKKPGYESEHCYINPVDSSHLALSHPHFDVWAAAMLKGPHLALLEKPPSHHLFNALNNNQLGQASPLERRIRANNQPAAPAMNFNLNIPAEVATLFRPHAPLAPPTLQTHAPGHNPTTIAHPLPVPQHSQHSLPVSNMLISSD